MVETVLNFYAIKYHCVNSNKARMDYLRFEVLRTFKRLGRQSRPRYQYFYTSHQTVLLFGLYARLYPTLKKWCNWSIFLPLITLTRN